MKTFKNKDMFLLKFKTANVFQLCF